MGDPVIAQASSSATDAAASLSGGGSYGLFLVETLLILVAVCLLAWIVLRFGVRKLYGAGAGASRGPVRILQRVPLESRRTLYVIEAAGKTLLVGASDGAAMTLLGELDSATVARELAAVAAPRSFLEILTAKRRAADVEKP